MIIARRERKSVAQSLNCNRSEVLQMRVSVVGRSVRQRGLRAIAPLCKQVDDKADAALLSGYEK
jgi:hypothetical protein